MTPEELDALMDGLTWPELRMLVWHTVGGPLPFPHDEAKAASVRLRDAHGLLSSVSTGEGAGAWACTPTGDAVVARLREIAGWLSDQDMALLSPVGEPPYDAYPLSEGFIRARNRKAPRRLHLLRLVRHGGHTYELLPRGRAVAEVARG